MSSISELIVKLTALVSALAALTVAFGYIASVISPPTPRAPLGLKGLLILLPVLIVAAILVTWQFRPAFVEADEPLTTKAWLAFSNGDLGEAISWSEQCIEEFRGTALRKQRELDEQEIPVPPEGAPRSETEKLTILERGPLNDVATTYFIAGRASEKLGDKQRAQRFYQRAAQLRHALTWDSEGEFFWSPSKSSEDRLGLLKE